MKTMNAQQVKETLDQETDFQLINVLPEEQHRQKHIPGSINVPVGLDDFPDRVENEVAGKGAKVVLYCANTDCDASSKATKKLEQAGFEDVADFEGGVAAWEEAGYPLEGAKAS